MSDAVINVGILSCAHLHAQSYAQCLVAHPKARLAGIYDADPERGQDAAREFGTAFFAQSDALLALGLDVAIVTSENVHHRALVEYAADAGVRAVLCEKPLATTTEDVQAMIDYCAAREVTLATAFPCRYAPVFTRGRELVQSGAIGEVLAVRGTNRGQCPGGWFVDPALSGGGAIIDHTVHVADLNRLLLGQEAVEVYAEAGKGFHHAAWEDAGLLSIRYSGGVVATLDTSWSRPKTFPTWGDVTLQIVGTAGVLDLDLFAQRLAHYDDARGRVQWPAWGSSIDAGLISDFLRVASGEAAPLLATGEDGLRALQVALAAYRSAASGQPVSI